MDRLYSFIITSSILILAVIWLRALFLRKISMRLQYAMWLFVAVKLLVCPVPYLESFLSVQNLLEPLESRIVQMQQAAGRRQDDSTDSAQKDHRTAQKQDNAQMQQKEERQDSGGLSRQKKRFGTGVYLEFMDSKTERIFVCAAGAGSLFLFLYFLAGNIRFAMYLHRKRIRWAENSCPLPVYFAEGLPSPCLYGKAVYLTPELASDEQRLSYIFMHEYCHYRQGDLFWSLLRCLCLISCWWNPLVWLAAYLSKQDCELACDEAAVKYLPKEERLAYGRTLVSLIPVQTNPKDCLSIAATMTEGGRNMKRRIQRIAQHQKSALSLGILVVFLLALCFVSVSTVKPASEPVQAGMEKEARKNDRQETISAEENGKKEALSADKDTSNVITGLDEAIGQAVLSDNEGSYMQGECVAEGHIKLGDEQGKDGNVTVYALTMYGEYEFHDGFFVKGSGTGVIPVVMKFSYDAGKGYVLQDYEPPKDGGYYVESVHELFPESLWDLCLNISDEMIAELTKQERIYAKRYLKKIGRKAGVGNYSDQEHPLLTDAGVSVEVSNKLCEWEKEGFWNYPDWIGSLERIEDGVRYVYEMALDKKAGEIVYTKKVYDTGKTVERFRVDMYTGEEL